MISPESCSTILHGDPSQGEALAEALRITAPALQELDIVDEIVAEPAGGAHLDHDGAAAAIRQAVLRGLSELAAVPAGDLRQQRHDRFRNHGRFI